MGPVDSEEKALARASFGGSNSNKPLYRPRRLFVLARHGESAANLAGIVSSDPGHLVPLTSRGESQAHQLGSQLANLSIDVAVGTAFVRTQRTIELALEARRVPILIDRNFDEIRAGDLDGATIRDYWSWKEHHSGSARFPNGESIDDALMRYVSGLQRLLSRTEQVTLVVLHEFALRRIAAAAAETECFPFSDGDIANGVPYLFDDLAIERAAERLDAKVTHNLLRRTVVRKRRCA